MSIVTEVEDQVLATIKRAEDAVLEGLQQWNVTVDGLVPDSVKDLPLPGNVVDSAFDFAQRLIGTQREFVASLFATLDSKEN